jgi:hypothetical protein
MMGKDGMLLRLCQFQEFGCCYFGDPTVRGKEYWPLLIAMFGRVLLHQFLNATKGELQLAKSFYTLSVVDWKVGT